MSDPWPPAWLEWPDEPRPEPVKNVADLVATAWEQWNAAHPDGCRPAFSDPWLCERLRRRG